MADIGVILFMVMVSQGKILKILSNVKINLDKTISYQIKKNVEEKKKILSL